MCLNFLGTNVTSDLENIDLKEKRKPFISYISKLHSFELWLKHIIKYVCINTWLSRPRRKLDFLNSHFYGETKEV